MTTTTYTRNKTQPVLDMGLTVFVERQSYTYKGEQCTHVQFAVADETGRVVGTGHNIGAAVRASRA